MPYDTETFKNLYSYPDRNKIRANIKKMIDDGELQPPKEQLKDTKNWINVLVDLEFREEKARWAESKKEANKAWQKHMEIEHGFEKLPDELKNQIHSYVWDRGHSGGYGEMNNLYCDVVDLALIGFKCGKES